MSSDGTRLHLLVDTCDIKENYYNNSETDRKIYNTEELIIKILESKDNPSFTHLYFFLNP